MTSEKICGSCEYFFPRSELCKAYGFKCLVCAENNPDYYAKYRKDNRVRAAVLRRKRGTVKSAYIPQLSRRIPDTCRYGRVLDTRSVFIWNNLPAASLVAGRAYRAMQWREIHCDRYGQVCR